MESLDDVVAVHNAVSQDSVDCNKSEEEEQYDISNDDEPGANTSDNNKSSSDLAKNEFSSNAAKVRLRPPSPTRSSASSSLTQAALSRRRRLRPALELLQQQQQGKNTAIVTPPTLVRQVTIPTYLPAQVQEKQQLLPLYSAPEPVPVEAPAPSTVASASRCGPGTANISVYSHSSTASQRVPADVRITVGTVAKGRAEFWHSSHILRYASPVLAAMLTTDDHAINASYFTLALPHKRPHEYKVLRPFLEPHAVTACTVTAELLPVLLPWFQELQLTVLLRDCDCILASMVWSTSKQSVATDLQDCLLAVQIAVQAGDSLPQTFSAATAVLSSYLTVRPDLILDTKASHRLDSALQVCRELANIVGHSPSARDVLWPALCMYLPTDLPVYEDKAALTVNPLFGYLLRQGLEQACLDSDGPSVSPARAASYTSTTDWQRDFERWWNIWNQTSNDGESIGDDDHEGESRRRSSSSNRQCDKRNSKSSRHPLRPVPQHHRFQSHQPVAVVDRTVWLEEILAKLTDAAPAIHSAAALINGDTFQAAMKTTMTVEPSPPYDEPEPQEFYQTQPHHQHQHQHVYPSIVSPTREETTRYYEATTYETTVYEKTADATARPVRRTFAC